jgi:hypothetical protein
MGVTCPYAAISRSGVTWASQVLQGTCARILFVSLESESSHGEVPLYTSQNWTLPLPQSCQRSGINAWIFRATQRRAALKADKTIEIGLKAGGV